MTTKKTKRKYTKTKHANTIKQNGKITKAKLYGPGVSERNYQTSNEKIAQKFCETMSKKKVTFIVVTGEGHHCQVMAGGSTENIAKAYQAVEQQIGGFLNDQIRQGLQEVLNNFGNAIVSDTEANKPSSTIAN